MFIFYDARFIELYHLFLLNQNKELFVINEIFHEKIHGNDYPQDCKRERENRKFEINIVIIFCVFIQFNSTKGTTKNNYSHLEGH